jgi:hypothetical protein
MFREYVEAGWAIVGFAPGTKGPDERMPGSKGWNTRERAITDPQRVNGMLQGGLLHAYSATCSIDIDNMAEARPFLAQHGIDLDALLNARNAVQIVSGRPNRAKLLYRLDKPLVSKKLCRYESLVNGKKYHALELRCATRQGKSVQDVLPPSIHPGTGKPYEWRYGSELIGSWRNLPPLPEALLALWQEGHAEPAEPAEDLLGALPDPLREEGPQEGPSMAELRFYLEHHTSDAYDDWVAVGMALHDATGGSPEGLLLWDEWSRKFPSYGEAKGGLPPQYPTDKWPSFTAGRNGNYTIGYLKSKAPPYVPLDSFPVTPEADAEFKAAAPGEPDRGVDTRPLAVIRRALEPLVFVTSQGTYYDRTRGVLVNRDSIDDMYTPAMPVLHITGNNGAVKTYTPKPRDELRRAPWKEIVDGIGMHPGAGTFFNENGRRYLNTYEPPAIEATPPTGPEQEAFEFMWSRPSEAIFRDWLLKFYAHAVQKPGVKIRMAPLLVGHTTGSGKSTLMRVLPELLFTRRYVATLTSDSLKEQFNDQLARAWWVHFEEMHSGNARAERVSVFNKVKPWVSEDTISIRPMYGARYDAPNRTQMTGASNYEDDALNVDDQDRRWAIGHIERSMSANEARDLYAFLESPRAPGVLHHIFRNVSLAGFNPNGRAPDTAAKRVMVRVNYGHWESELLELIANGTPPFNKDLVVITDILPYVKQGGITASRLQRIVGRPPFNFAKLGNGYGKQLWAWRNTEMWQAVSAQARIDYYEGGVRPAGWEVSDALPAPLAEACGFNSD